MTDWVRLWHDMPTDPKWRVVARKSGQPLPCVIALFTHMLAFASASAERGVLVAWEHEDAAAALDMDEEQVAAIYDAMQGKVLNGLHLTGWERRQPKREREDNSNARVAKHREKNKKVAALNGDTDDVTPCNATVTPPRGETETETEEKILVSSNDETCASAEAEALGSDPDDPDDGDKLKPEHVVEIWNETAETLGRPTIRKLTPERRQLLKARIARHDIDDFQTVFGNIRGSPFLRGDTPRWPGVTFDWTFKQANFQKTLEGNYNG